MCEACERGDHVNCGMQTWCECDCGGYHDAGIPEIDERPHCAHDYEWKTQPSTVNGPEEHFKICKNCGAEEPGSYW
jgi:hypothetical protein